MNLDLALILLMLAAAIAMFVINRPRMDAVALLVMVSMPFTGIITMNEALAGFADPSIILIAALFVIGEGLVRTGVARRLGDWLDAKAGSSENRLLILLMAAVGGLGSLMSSTAVVAIFIPVVLRISQNRGMAPSRLMMPLSFAALISGMLTLVATAPNLVVNAELIRQGAQGFGFFSFTPFGLPLLALGIIYMLFARGLLSSKSPPAAADRRPRLARWIEQYGLADREKRGRISAGSSLVGKRLDELSLRAAGVNLLAIERGTGFAAKVLRPTAQTELQAGDVLLADVDISNDGANELWQSLKLEPRPLSEIGNYFVDRSQEIGTAEVILPAESTLIGQTVLEARIRSEYGLTVIGLRHGNKVVMHDLLGERLKIGDTLLLIGFWSDIQDLQSHIDDVVVLNMPVELEEVLPAAQRAPHALAVLGLVVALMVSGVGAERPGRADWLPADGAFGLRRFQQRLSLHQLEDPHPDRRHAAVLAGPAADGRRRSRCRRGGRPGWRRRAAFRIGDLVRHHGGAGLVHLQYGHGRTDGARGAGHRQGPRSLALSVRDDRRAGRVNRFHDADLLAGEHAGRRTRAI